MAKKANVGPEFFNSYSQRSVELIMLKAKLSKVIPQEYTLCNCCTEAGECPNYQKGIIPHEPCMEGLLDSTKIRSIIQDTQEVR